MIAPSDSVQSQAVKLLIRKLTTMCNSYCILTGYESLPERIHSDIDFMVNARDFGKMPRLVDEIAKDVGADFFQVIPHEISARAFRLVSKREDGFQFVQLDACFDYRHFGRLWLKADEVLEARRWHSNGFWIQSACHEFVYYLIKRINKRDFTEIHASRLSRLYAEDAEGCVRLLSRFWPPKSSESLGTMAEQRQWQSLISNLEAYRSELWRYSHEGVAASMASHCKRGYQLLERVCQPTGAWIAFIGPDGCGKSSVIDGVASTFDPIFDKVVRYHLRPKVLPARSNDESIVTDPHHLPARSNVVSVAKLLYLAVDYWLGYLIRVRTNTMRSRLVIFDRYFYDILVDPRRILYGGPIWLLRLVTRILPVPELVILMNASPEVLWSRKREVTFHEVVRQQKDFLAIANSLETAAAVDANQPLPDVVGTVCKLIVNQLSTRTRSRLWSTKRTGIGVGES